MAGGKALAGTHDGFPWRRCAYRCELGRRQSDIFEKTRIKRRVLAEPPAGAVVLAPDAGHQSTFEDRDPLAGRPIFGVAESLVIRLTRHVPARRARFGWRRRS